MSNVVAALIARSFLGAVSLVAVVGLPATAQQTLPAGPSALVDKGLVGVGRLPGNLSDRFGETFGSGSGMAVDPTTWTRGPDGYTGTIYLLPDRGYNAVGTIDYQPRVNRIAVRLRPANAPEALDPQALQHTVEATLVDTIKLTDAAGEPLTGLDPQADMRAGADGFPPLPQAPNGRVSLDPEAIVRLADGSFFISDEYGPYIYRFSAEGRMMSAIRPPDAFIPRRRGVDHFSSNNPPPGVPAPVPPQPQTGRQNNQGFEGLALSPDGRFLATILQSATRQDGGDSFDTREHSRMLVYDITDPARPVLAREHVVPLPVFDADGQRQVAAQSELLALDATRFLLLCRDGGNGYGLPGAASRFRRIMLVDISAATNIAGSVHDGLVAVAPKGVLAAGIVPASVRSFIDINDNAMLGRFGLRNGLPNDRNNLTEKWEALGLLPALDLAFPHDFFLLVANDNDFVTQDGFQAGTAYRDPSGFDLDTIFLAYRITVPPAK